MKLSRKPHPHISLAPGGPALSLGRAHEVTGRAAKVFAAMVVRRLTGPVIWARPEHARDILPPVGLAPFFDLSRLIIVRAPCANTLLWTAEEALRSGAAPVIIAEPEEPPALTPLRRLQLAAEAGAAQVGEVSPLCLILSPRIGTAGAVESRWVCAPLPSEHQQPRWRFECIYAKSTPPVVWETTAPPHESTGRAAQHFNETAA